MPKRKNISVQVDGPQSHRGGYLISHEGVPSRVPKGSIFVGFLCRIFYKFILTKKREYLVQIWNTEPRWSRILEFLNFPNLWVANLYSSKRKNIFTVYIFSKKHTHTMADIWFSIKRTRIWKQAEHFGLPGSKVTGTNENVRYSVVL